MSLSIADSTTGPMYPTYYVEPEGLTKDDCENVKSSWAFITDDTSPEYQNHKSETNVESAATWFFDSFYGQLFLVAPETRPLFKNSLQSQGKALVKMISVALSVLDDNSTLVPALQNLAVLHTKRGVTCPQYGIVGEVLLWTLKKVLGSEFTKPGVEESWLKLYCLMLKVMLPAAYAAELQMASEKPEMSVEGHENTASETTLIGTETAAGETEITADI